MLENGELESSTIIDSKVDEEEALVSTDSVEVKGDFEDSITEQAEQSNSQSSFKPLSFSNGTNSKFHSGVSFELASEKTDAEKINISEGFKNSEFFYENSLLTNAEDFANSIREGAKIHKEKLLSNIEEKANDTDRIHKQILSENEEAKQQREELINSAKEEVEEIKKEAFQEGYDDGYKMGMQARYDESKPLATQANTLLEQLNSLRQVVRFQAEKELVNLAMKIAKNIVSEEIGLNDSVVENIVKVALQETEMKGKVYLHLNPQDYEFLVNSKCDLEKYLSDEQKLLIRQKSELKPGSIFVESDGEVISRSIESQFKKIEDTLNEQIDKREAKLNELDTDLDDSSLNANIESENSSQLDSFDDGTDHNADSEGGISDNEDIQQGGETSNLYQDKIDLEESQMDQIEEIGENSKKNEEEILDNSLKSEFLEEKGQVSESIPMELDTNANLDESQK